MTVYSGRKFKRKVESMPINLAGLAKKSGVSRQWLYRLMNDNRNITPDLAQRLAMSLGCDVSELEEEDEPSRT